MEEVNQIFRETADSPLKGIVEYTEEELVSREFKENTHSCILDAPSTLVMQSDMVKTVGWQDNEWGYSCRTADLCAYVAGKDI